MIQTKEHVIKHLELIQLVINRLASNSFMFKGWSMTLIVAITVLMVRYKLDNPFVILSILIPIIGFWVLGGYFVRQERLFRRLYEETSKLTDTDFSMNTDRFKNESHCRRRSALRSTPLVGFYFIEAIFILLVFLISK